MPELQVNDIAMYTGHGHYVHRGDMVRVLRIDYYPHNAASDVAVYPLKWHTAGVPAIFQQRARGKLGIAHMFLDNSLLTMVSRCIFPKEVIQLEGQ